jgi:hypothetical protein
MITGWREKMVKALQLNGTGHGTDRGNAAMAPTQSAPT